MSLSTSYCSSFNKIIGLEYSYLIIRVTGKIIGLATNNLLGLIHALFNFGYNLKPAKRNCK